MMTDMNTYLLARNPNRWEWDNMEEMFNEVKNGNLVHDRWSSGVPKRPKTGDRFSLIRLGEEPKGIFAILEIRRTNLREGSVGWEQISLAERVLSRLRSRGVV